MRRRRVFGVIIIAIAMIAWVFQYQTAMTSHTQSVPNRQPTPAKPVELPMSPAAIPGPSTPESALTLLETLAVKGRAPKTGYERTNFGDGWLSIGNCDMRNVILHRDLTGVVVSNACKVQSGVLNDPYTGSLINFVRGAETSDDVQIDHVVALSHAWQTGAQLLDVQTRVKFANDPLELLAVDGKANQAKGDGDAATWLPANKAFRCQYIARQIAVKAKYSLWVTPPEKEAMQRVLDTCPGQTVPVIAQ